MNQPDETAATDTEPLQNFEIHFESGEFAVRQALARFISALGPLDLNVEERGMVEIVLAEVLNNIVEHAYPDPAQIGSIGISCVHQPDGLQVKICDSGHPMPQERLPTGRLASVDVELKDMPEGGFGWFLIQHLAKDVSYQRVGHENHLSMRLAVGCSS
ncbi:MAG: ATP-binding protein [Roseobacter sp.]